MSTLISDNLSRSGKHAVSSVDPPSVPAQELPVRLIGRRPNWQLVDLAELWRYRELLLLLGWRDISIRFKQTILGFAWALFQPLATMMVFALFFGRLGGLNATIPNYALFVFAGVVPWTFFANAIAAAGNSIVSNERLVTKIYFPRLLIPLSAIGAPLFDFLISFVLMLGMMVWYGQMPNWEILLLPMLTVLLILVAMGTGIFLSALIVAQRDFKFILNFGVQLWMFATPCIYMEPIGFGPLAQRWLPLNPAYGIILNFRRALLDGPIDWYSLGVSTSVGLAMLILALAYFRRVERSFADVI